MTQIARTNSSRPKYDISLFDLIRRELLPDARKLHVIQRVIAALRFMHDLGVVHRDLKPMNIMVSSDAEKVVLIDFGHSAPAGGMQSRLTGTITHIVRQFERITTVLTPPLAERRPGSGAR